ncbi:DNA polymerase [Sphingomonas desiccabilis]|uniref:DNA polymerase I n=1 Tax=Sphingomonas desiccabilis TaxID=429134 RepID=A0A4Q2IZA0_9SPHN|nr:DNA polymerase [Sphingomonas desiccabilis]MBB3910123.1 DNA polymerase I-like protein with 3'-5' exonuclease and polymerase domains [Sphingomonas desiccabilis]RXZ34808.1 DNA polymerase [Sphingomonas desiccabilis]
MIDLLTARSRGRYVFDLETNGLLAGVTRVHCAVLYDIDTDEILDFRPHEIGKFLEIYQRATLLIGHNIIGYDIPVLAKLYGVRHSPDCEIIDTLPLARLVYSDIKQTDFPLAKAWKAYKAKVDAWDQKRERSRLDHEADIADVDFTEEPPEWRDPGPYPYTASAPLEFPGQFVGSHSLEAWGYRLGAERKGDYSKEMKAQGLDPWESWNEAMHAYMIQDSRVNVTLYRHLMEEGVEPLAVALEMACQALVCRMERNGWPLDVRKAQELYARLSQRRHELEVALREAFPPWQVQLEDFIPKRNNKAKGYIAGVPVERWETREFNPASRDHIADRLTAKYGWEPTEFTDGGSPKVDDDILQSLPFPEAKLLAEYFLIQKRVGQLGEGNNAWLKLVTKKGRIHGRYNSNGALTGRATHSSPNIAQVPSVGAEYGWDCRVLFHVPIGWKQLGADQSGLELRCLGSFLAVFDGGAYIKTVLFGDIHWENAKALFGLDPDLLRDEKNHPEHKKYRDVAKTFIYAFLYGAGPEKLGSIPGVTAEERKLWRSDPKHLKALRAIQDRFRRRRQPVPNGTQLCHIYKGEQLTERFLKSFPALKRLLKVVKDAAKKGWLKGLDGRKLPIRSEHAALNTLLQSAGAVICKSWITMAEKALVEAGFKLSEGLGEDWDRDADVVFLGWIHDELQVAVREGLEEKVSAILIETGRQAGAPFASWKCPTDVEVKPGANWAECH